MSSMRADEQRRIVAKMGQRMALLDALEQHLAASRDAAEKLLSALVVELTAGSESHFDSDSLPQAAEDPVPYNS